MIEGITFEPPPMLFIILSLLVGVIVGWVIGFLDSNLRSAKKIEAAEARAEVAVQEAEQRVAAAAAAAGAEPKPLPPFVADDPGLLRLRSVNGILTLEIDGALAFDRPVAAARKQRLLELLALVRPWLEGGSAVAAEVKPSAGAMPRPEPRPVPAAAPAQPPASGVKDEDPRNLLSLSIVAQIDSVLQKRLADTAYAGRGIRLTEGAGGAVEVYVGLEKYPAIDAVPDPQIQFAIRSAIAEWENSAPGG